MKEEIPKFVGKKIKYYRNKKGLTQKELGALVGVKHNTISSYENATNEAEQEILYAIITVLGISINDLFPSTVNNGVLEEDNPSPQSSYRFYPTPVAAGVPTTIEGTAPKGVEMPDAVMGKHAGSEDVFFLKINGDSMNKIIPNDSLIAVKKVNLDALSNNDIVVFSNDHDYSVKRYYNDEDNQRLIFKSESTNPAFTDYIVKYEGAKSLEFHGKVVLYIVSTD